MRRDYIGLWLLLAISLALFVWLWVNEGVAHDLHLRTAPIDELLRVDSMTNVVMPEAEAPEDVVRAPLDTTSKTILLVGDSMLEGLGTRLAAYCEKNGHAVTRVIWYSSTTKVWGTSRRLEGFISRFKPDYVMVCLGANELFVTDIKEKRRGYVREILRQIGDLPYIWIGPPNWKDDTGINELLAEECAQGCFYLSKGGTFEREKDGAHPTKESAALWMDRVCRWIEDESSHPIRLDKPDKMGGYCRTVVLQPNDR